MAPPEQAVLPDGVEVDLRQLATEISIEHLNGHPADVKRYGDAIRAWCIHDNQHLLNWAVLAVSRGLDFAAQVAWLANVLHSRDYPLASLADDLVTAASTVRRRVDSSYSDDLANVLLSGIDFVEPR